MQMTNIKSFDCDYSDKSIQTGIYHVDLLRKFETHLDQNKNKELYLYFIFLDFIYPTNLNMVKVVTQHAKQFL